MRIRFRGGTERPSDAMERRLAEFCDQPLVKRDDEALPMEAPATPAPTPSPRPDGNTPSEPLLQPRPRGQATGADSRAERYVRQVRTEVQDLRTAIEELSAAQDGMLELDLAEVQANPAAAAALPGPVLVRALTAAADQIAELERQMSEQQDELDTVRDRLGAVQRDEAWLRGRMETLEQVIGALHANLEDLRVTRELPVVEAPLALPERPMKPARTAHGEGA